MMAINTLNPKTLVSHKSQKTYSEPCPGQRLHSTGTGSDRTPGRRPRPLGPQSFKVGAPYSGFRPWCLVPSAQNQVIGPGLSWKNKRYSKPLEGSPAWARLTSRPIEVS